MQFNAAKWMILRLTTRESRRDRIWLTPIHPHWAPKGKTFKYGLIETNWIWMLSRFNHWFGWRVVVGLGKCMLSLKPAWNRPRHRGGNITWKWPMFGRPVTCPVVIGSVPCRRRIPVERPITGTKSMLRLWLKLGRSSAIYLNFPKKLNRSTKNLVDITESRSLVDTCPTGVISPFSKL